MELRSMTVLLTLLTESSSCPRNNPLISEPKPAKPLLIFCLLGGTGGDWTQVLAHTEKYLTIELPSLPPTDSFILGLALEIDTVSHVNGIGGLF